MEEDRIGDYSLPVLLYYRGTFACVMAFVCADVRVAHAQSNTKRILNTTYDVRVFVSI